MINFLPKGNEVILRYLLEHDGKKDEVDNVGRTPLHWAVIQGVVSWYQVVKKIKILQNFGHHICPLYSNANPLPANSEYFFWNKS